MRPRGLIELDDAVAGGDLDDVRVVLQRLDGEERSVLEAELGPEDLDDLLEWAGRPPTRGGKNGRVVVVPGVTGTLLDVVRGGDADRIWVNPLRLMGGRLSDLRLDDDGRQPAGSVVRTAGLQARTYLPLATHLDRDWHVLLCPYDWRLRLEESAAAFADTVRQWGDGDTVHVVAHSMGGLVVRRALCDHPQLLDGGEGERGRVILLGTPNHGSFDIPKVLSGQDRMVRRLALVDHEHDAHEIAGILGTFPGLYALLPSPSRTIDVADASADALYSVAGWGGAPVRQGLLDYAASFHETLREVGDPSRFTYIAGYDLPTPFGVTLVPGGGLEFGTTNDGDGRVPHVLGLLEGVTTYWSDEVHGALTRDPAVLAAMNDLLGGGVPDPAVLPATRPTRARRDAGEAERRPPVEDGWGIPEAAMADLAWLERTTRTGSVETIGDVQKAARVGAAITDGFLAPPASPQADGAGSLRDVAGGRGSGRRHRGTRRALPRIVLEVAWGDIGSFTECDVVSVGHYAGILPQNAELALDFAISGEEWKKRKTAEGTEESTWEGGIITEQTRRGIIRGNLGDMRWIPWEGDDRVALVAGMGRPGSFGEADLRRLVRTLYATVGSTVRGGRLATVLIGSGEGTLTMRQSVTAWLAGLREARLTDVQYPVRRITFVERQALRAEELVNCLRAHLDDDDPDIQVSPGDLPAVISGARVTMPDAVALTAASIARVISEGGRDAATAKRLLKNTGLQGEHEKQLVEWLDEFGGQGGPIFDLAGTLDVRKSPGAGDKANERGRETLSTRLSFIGDRGHLRVAAITETTTIPERVLDRDMALLNELVRRMTNPQMHEVPELSAYFARQVLPNEFVNHLRGSSPVVVEVDRATAPLHWEMLAGDGAGDDLPYLALNRPLARQMRTTRATLPRSRGRTNDVLRVLIIGDPGGGRLRLEGARREALEMRERLLASGRVEVTALIGAPSDPPDPRLVGIPPADRLSCLMKIHSGEFDVLHYAGHGQFAEKEERTAGWLFEDGLITARELMNADRLPPLVVANACLSSRTSVTTEDGASAGSPQDDAHLVASLADAFFEAGVRDYIGTAWPVDDAGAVDFAEHFYRALLDDNPMSIGQSVLEARRALHGARASFGALWAAYQHYGDPGSRNRVLDKESR